MAKPPELPQATLDKIVGLYRQNRFGAVVTAVSKLLPKYPDVPALWNLLGGACLQTGRPEKALQAYRSAAKLTPNVPSAFFLVGVVSGKLGQHGDAVVALNRAIKLKPDYADAYVSMGNALRQLGKIDPALNAYGAALKINPAQAGVHIKIGNIRQDQGLTDQAVTAFQAALTIDPQSAAAANNLANSLQQRGDLHDAITWYRKTIDLDPDAVMAVAHLQHLLQHICDWPALAVHMGARSELGTTTDPVPPFGLLPYEDDPAKQLTRSRKWAATQFAGRPLPITDGPQRSRLRLGYFGADFHDHATMHLMAGLLRHHDRTTFEIFAYSYGRSISDELRTRAQEGVDHFCDVAMQPDADIVKLARTHQLDIAIDLKGYTTGSRSGLFQHRLAPVQINYLGYPGSMGAPFIDYILADQVVIGPDQRAHYSEAVISMPSSYQPNDNLREIAQTTTTRADFGLPEDAVVLCCFNNNYKILPPEFDIWMGVLGQVENGVLWLLRSNPWAEDNLRKEAAARGIDPARLVFAEKLPQAEHLARHKHADFFVDTFICNAHTTASDALWAGLPVVTKQGDQFAARVAASVLHAVGLPELVTTTDSDYADLVLKLAKRPAFVAQLRERLLRNRLTEPLFDTQQYTRDFERGLQLSVERARKGARPQDIMLGQRAE
jgi:predicted O-linked N-acetylglucosamine transferase (SPINDLY family)